MLTSKLRLGLRRAFSFQVFWPKLSILSLSHFMYTVCLFYVTLLALVTQYYLIKITNYKAHRALLSTPSLLSAFHPEQPLLQYLQNEEPNFTPYKTNKMTVLYILILMNWNGRQKSFVRTRIFLILDFVFHTIINTNRRLGRNCIKRIIKHVQWKNDYGSVWVRWARTRPHPEHLFYILANPCYMRSKHCRLADEGILLQKRIDGRNKTADTATTEFPKFLHVAATRSTVTEYQTTLSHLTPPTPFFSEIQVFLYYPAAIRQAFLLLPARLS